PPAAAPRAPAPAPTPTPTPEPSPAPGPSTPVSPPEPLGEGNGVNFRSADGVNTLQLGFAGQIRFRVFDRDQFRRTDRTDTAPPIPVENIGQIEKSFSIKLLRLYLQGTAFKPWLAYKLETNLVANDEGLREVFIPPIDTNTNPTTPAVLIRSGSESQDERTLKLVDFYIDAVPNDLAGFRGGQFKVPVGRQELVSDVRLQMPERSIASLFFAPGRDRGFMVHGATPQKKIGYQIGVFNGTGLAQGQNTDDTLAYAFRLTGTNGGPYLYVESVVDNPDKFHAQGGVSWYKSARRTTQTSDPLSLLGDIEDNRLSADLEFFWPKVNLLAEYFQGKIRLDDSIQPRMQEICFGAFQAGLSTCDQQGFNVQAGMLFGGRHEISGRYSIVDPDREFERDRQKEASMAYTAFFRKHALRWTTSLTALTLEVNAPGSSGLAVQRGDSSIPLVVGFPNPEAFSPVLEDDKNKLLITQLQWIF
ncbi:MAG TPA: porin, partial [Candidatus Polarisedimenticolia bacterium]|nr:porin [Candidatus Polarisedimenticolia bacterium]